MADEQASNKLSEARVAEFREAFNLFDTNGDGGISQKELMTVMRRLGTNPIEDEVNAMIAEIDTDKSGVIEFNEFCMMMAKNEEKDKVEDLRDAFKVFDKDGNNKIDAAELKLVMTSIGEKLTDDEVNEMMQEADLNKDGFIDYEEFVKMMS